MNSQTMSQSIQAPSPANAILRQMQGQTITQGWDVVCAMDADKINQLLAQQYALKIFQNSNLPPFSGTVTLQAGVLAIEFINVVLGSPLISFISDSNDANLQINFVSGTVNTIGADNLIIDSQSISPGDGYQLTGVVPLSSVDGEVENGHDVVLDIKNGAAFTAHLGFASGAATLLGQYFLTFLQANASTFKYILGTLVYSSTGTNLTPVIFDLATQVDRTDPNDKGCLLLFIATTSSCPNGPGTCKGGTQTALGIANVVPSGYSTTLIVSSQVLFQDILLPVLKANLASVSPTIQAVQSSSNSQSNYILEVTAGECSLPPVQYSPGLDEYIYSGEIVEGDFGKEVKQEPVAVPVYPLQVVPQQFNNLVINGNVSWSQPWVDAIIGKAGWGYSPGSINMSAAISLTSSLSVDPTTQVVSFKNTNTKIDVSFDHSSIWSKIFGGGLNSDVVGNIISSGTQQVLQSILGFQLPQVNTFAVSNLLFPGQHILNFQNVYLPGDLVIFGDIDTSSVATSPASATVAASQTQQFTATSNGQPASVTWSISPRKGQISTTGLYTAPSSVSRPQNILVTATTSDNQTSHAVVTLVPAGVLLAPNVAIVQNNAPQSFVASVAGDGNQAVTWSINPAGVGTIAADGTYTPPASVKSPTSVTITATSQANPKVQGSALAVVLTGLETGGIAVSPTSASLQSSQIQQFKAENKAGKLLTPTWSVVSAVSIAGNAGSIDANGNYTAPATITSPQVVVVVATLQDDVTSNTLATTALVYLEPPTDN